MKDGVIVKEKIYFYDTRIGKIGISEKNGYITNIYFNENIDMSLYILEESEYIKEAKKELDEYFNGNRKAFSVKYKYHGTPFQKKVWDALINIPYGEVATYKDIAEKIGHPKAYRAVGLANNRNQLPIIIPCHRVIGVNSKLVGYGGGLGIKKELLKIENVDIDLLK